MKDKDLEKIIIMSLSAILIIITMLYVFFSSNIFKKEEDIKYHKDIDLIINNIKSDYAYLDLEYESVIDKLTVLVYKESDFNSEDLKVANERYKSVIVDMETGKEITFQDLIREDKTSNFLQKEEELLSYKYPEFIVRGIKENVNSSGNKFYYVKDNEVIVYYYDYQFDEPYSFPLTLRVNYNEIKDYISFKPNFDQDYQNEDGYNYSKEKKVIALTFDDGPSSTYNAKILEELEKNKAHATFFMVGQMMNSCGKCVLDTYKSGNEVASHSYEHMNIKTNSQEKVNESLNKVNEIYKSITGDEIKYLRPPYGAYSKTNLENATVPFILWDMDTEDWRYRDVDHIVNYVLDNAQDGSIILMHELYETSYEALKVFLPKLYANGYQVVSISELASLKNRTLEVGKAYTGLH